MGIVGRGGCGGSDGGIRRIRRVIRRPHRRRAFGAHFPLFGSTSRGPDSRPDRRDHRRRDVSSGVARGDDGHEAQRERRRAAPHAVCNLLWRPANSIPEGTNSWDQHHIRISARGDINRAPVRLPPVRGKKAGALPLWDTTHRAGCGRLVALHEHRYDRGTMAEDPARIVSPSLRDDDPAVRALESPARRPDLSRPRAVSATRKVPNASTAHLPRHPVSAIPRPASSARGRSPRTISPRRTTRRTTSCPRTSGSSSSASPTCTFS